MSKNNVKKVIDYLVNKWGDRPCPMCQEINWNVSDKVYELSEYDSSFSNLVAQTVFPVIPILCRNCGNSIFLNAVLAGIVESEIIAASDSEKIDGEA